MYINHFPGFTNENIEPLLRHATDEELRLLHQQAKDLRRQSEQERQFRGESLFQEVNLQHFESHTVQTQPIVPPWSSQAVLKMEQKQPQVVKIFKVITIIFQRCKKRQI